MFARGLTARRKALAMVAAALALSVTGMAPAAQAQSGSASITGTVEIPSGLDLRSLAVNAWHFASRAGVTGWMLAQSGRVSADGSFVISGLEPGREYRLELRPGHVSRTSLVGGFYTGPESPYAYRAAGGTSLRPPASGLDLRFEERGEITGTFTLPERFEDDALSPPTFVLFDTTQSNEGQLGPWSSPWWAVMNNYDISRVGPRTWEYSAPGIREGVPHALYVYRYEDSGFAAGYFHAGVAGLVGDPEHATLVHAGQQLTGEVTGGLSTPRLTGYEAPEISGKAVVGEELSLEPARWSMRVSSERYQWLRDGQEVAGQTGTRYVLTEADLGSRISVRGVATKAGFPQAQIDSEPSGQVVLPSLRATSAPKVSGTARLGKTLAATPGSWSEKGTSVSYQWLREGKAIQGATTRSYLLTTSDVGKRVSVRVTASRAGFQSAASSSASVKVAKAQGTLKASAKKVKASKRAKVVVRVKAAGFPKPSGTVRVKVGKKTVKAKLKTSAQGKVAVRLPKLKKGRYKLTVRFDASSKTARYVTKPKAARLTLRVR